jgi:phage shock protein A
MNTELVNIYIERLLNEVGEGVKTRILLETQLKYTEQINQNLQKEIESLKSEYEEYKKKQENINKRRKTKEVDTSEDNF